MPNLMGGWFIPVNVCQAIVQDMKNRQNLYNRSHSSRGYHYLSNYEINPSLLRAYEKCLDDVVTQYTNYFPYSKEGMAGWIREDRYNFQFYEPGSSYSTWHCENNGEPQFITRHLAFMTYLNTVEKGGETHFLHQGSKIKPEIGLTLVWPAYFTHTHRGIPAKTEEKYITTGWYKFFNTENFMESTENMSDVDFYKNIDEILSKVT